MPSHVYIVPLDVTTGKWGDEGEDKAKLQAKTKADYEKALMERLPEIVPCSLYHGTEKDGCLISAEYVQVDNGDAVLRTVFAFGAGKSKVILATQIKDLVTGKTIAEFTASGDSGAGIVEPGGAYGGMAANTTGKDITRIAREIRNEIKRLIGRD